MDKLDLLTGPTASALDILSGPESPCTLMAAEPQVTLMGPQVNIMGPQIDLLGRPVDIMGLGAALDDEAAKAMGEALAKKFNLASWDLAAALKPLDDASRQKVVAAYYAAGGDSSKMTRALEDIDQHSRTGLWVRANPVVSTIWGVLATASFAACVYHGYKRNNGSLGWAIGWGLLGTLFPVITPTIALAQGFGKPIEK